MFLTVVISILLSIALFLPGCSRAGTDIYSGRYGRQTVQAYQNAMQYSEKSLAPTYREQRQARATLEAMEENDKLIGTIGGDYIIRSDGTASKPDQVRFVAQPGALTLDVEASPCLNQVDGTPHALRLVVYHLSDTFKLEQLKRSQEGIRHLLEGDSFDQSVRSVRVFDMQPGQSCRLRLDRADNGKYVALVAGFHSPDPARSVISAEYPIDMFVQQTDDLLLKRKVIVYSPRPLHLRLTLDERSLSLTQYDADVNHIVQARAKNTQQLRWAR